VNKPKVSYKKFKALSFDSQVGGDHYTKMKIQPMQFSMANNLNAMQHTIIKYVTRVDLKGNGDEDIDKAIHTLQLWKQWRKDHGH
tara:strand:- start:308 stop:562 length:255 start_codon:yes stop_codon:yes gene_type:complete